VDYRLLYTQKALNDLVESIGQIADDDAEAASRFAESSLDHLELRVRFPRMGSTIPKGARERKLSHSPILAYYQSPRGATPDRGPSLARWVAPTAERIKVLMMDNYCCTA
jgi:plasmid stabilization system protein ParE